EAGDDGELLLETFEAFADGRKRDAIGAVLVLVPAGAEPELDPPAAHLVDLGHGDGEWTRVPEGGRGEQRAEPDARGLPGQAGEGGPRFGGPGLPADAAHAEKMVGAEEPIEAELFGGSCHGKELVVGRALLGLGEDPQLHGG